MISTAALIHTTLLSLLLFLPSHSWFLLLSPLGATFRLLSYIVLPTDFHVIPYSLFASR